MSALADPIAAPHRRSTAETIWRARWQYLAISPFYVLFAVFGLFPLLYTIVLSFHAWSGAGPWEAVGLENYASLASHDQFLASLSNSLAYLVAGVPVLVVGSLVAAVVLNDARLRFRGLYRTVFFLPYVTSEIIIAIVFIAVFDQHFGWVNGVFRAVGLPTVPWLTAQEWSKVPVLALFVWSRLGYYLILMLGGLQTVPQEIYEAASIDGASPTQQFLFITVPLMRGIILFVLVTTTIAVLNLFGAPYILTGGGPANSSSTLTLVLYQTAFLWANYGLASAIAVVIALITIVIALVQIRLLRFGD
jgi:ABC-type sugar transport system permease subunit